MKKLVFALSFILLFSCNRKPEEIQQTRVDGYIQAELVDNGYLPFYRISLDSARCAELSGLNWFLIQYDPLQPEEVLFREELAFAPELLIPASLSGRWFVTFAAVTTEREAIVGTPVELVPTQTLTQVPEKIYLTLDRPGLTLPIYGALRKAHTPSEKAMEPVYQYGDYTFYAFLQPGFYQLNCAESPFLPDSFNIFVSPVPSIHTDRIDRDWYFTQFRTLTTSNCGPTVVSMGIAWANGQTVSVSRVRDHIGWQGSGAVNFLQMQAVLRSYNVESVILDFQSKDQIFDLIDQDKLVGIVYNMAGVSYQQDPANNLFDQYYVDHGGHYLAVKGYSADKKYFIIYDPIPSNWRTNAERYSDQTSMYGRNRYYLADELVAALLRPQILVMSRG